MAKLADTVFPSQTVVDGDPINLGAHVTATADGTLSVNVTLNVDYAGAGFELVLRVAGSVRTSSQVSVSDDFGYYGGSVNYAKDVTVNRGDSVEILVVGDDLQINDGYASFTYIQTTPSYEHVLAVNAGNNTYARQIATAKRLIAAKGRSCVWSQMGSGTPSDPAKPWKPGEAVPDTYDVSIVFLPLGANAAFLRSLGETDIPVGDDYGLMAAVDFVPTQRAEIYAADGVTLLRKVLRYNVLAPDGDPILYTVYFGVDE